MTRAGTSLGLTWVLVAMLTAFPSHASVVAKKPSRSLRYTETFGMNVSPLAGGTSWVKRFSGSTRLDVKIEDPAIGFDPSSFTENTQFTVGSSAMTLDFKLGDDPHYKPGDKKANFIVKWWMFLNPLSPNPVALKFVNCRVSWDDDSLRVKLHIRTPHPSAGLLASPMTKKYIDVPEGEYVYAEEHYVTLAGVQFKFPVKLDAKIKRVHLTKLSMTSGDDLWNLKFSFKGETLLP